MSLAGVAKETLDLLERGAYRAPSGAEVSIRDAVDRAVRGTVLYRPDELDRLLEARGPGPAGLAPRVEVSSETTGQAARRLVQAEGLRVLALNFASAKNPGGGFLNGSQAQEESLARCSALYPCLLTQREYYEQNRAWPSLLYTDHLIYSPDVPFFRDARLELLEAPFLASVLTAPAPNAGEELRRDPHAGPRIRAALELRAAKLLLVAALQGHRCLVLGAWGCGVFRNDPAAVAEVFAGALGHPRLAGSFERVVFAVYERGGSGPNLRAFQQRFGP
jgi:uncharacterized protein (TIGR02452 family)